MSLPTFQEMWSRYLFNNKVPKIGDGYGAAFNIA